MGNINFALHGDNCQISSRGYTDVWGEWQLEPFFDRIGPQQAGLVTSLLSWHSAVAAREQTLSRPQRCAPSSDPSG